MPLPGSDIILMVKVKFLFYKMHFILKISN